MILVVVEIGALTVADRKGCVGVANQADFDVLAGFVARLVVELGLEHAGTAALRAVDRSGGLDTVPVQGQGVGTFLGGADEGPIVGAALGVGENAANQIINAIRVRYHGRDHQLVIAVYAGQIGTQVENDGCTAAAVALTTQALQVAAALAISLFCALVTAVVHPVFGVARADDAGIWILHFAITGFFAGGELLVAAALAISLLCALVTAVVHPVFGVARADDAGIWILHFASTGFFAGGELLVAAALAAAGLFRILAAAVDPGNFSVDADGVVSGGAVAAIAVAT